jgi:hypothetical protein
LTDIKVLVNIAATPFEKTPLSLLAYKLHDVIYLNDVKEKDIPRAVKIWGFYNRKFMTKITCAHLPEWKDNGVSYFL